MGADIDISKFLHPLDLVSPVEAALHLREARENETTQRMYAQNQMARQSAADFRDERDHREKMAKEEEDRKIAWANAVRDASQMAHTPGGLGPARALLEAHGGHLNPLTAAVAPPPPPQGDATDQLLASPEGAAAAMPAAGPGPVEGPAPPPGVQSGGMAPVTAADRLGPGGYPLEGPQQLQHAPEGDFLLPTAMHVSPGMQGAMDHQGFVPRGAEPLQPPAGPGAPAAAGDLESLMSRAAPQPTAKPEAPPMPLLYEAVLGDRHYPISAEQPKTGLAPKYEAVAQQYMQMGASPKDAFGKAFTEQLADEKAAATEKRMMDVMGGRNTQQDTRDATFRLTAEQIQARDAARLENAQKVARINASGRGAASPAGETALAHMIALKEQGAPDSEIAAFAAANHVDPKVWNAPVKNVSTEANQNTRTTERRAALDVTDENGNSLGPAKSSQLATKMANQTQSWGQLRLRYQALIDDVRENGSRINPADVAAVQRRESLFNLAQGAARQYNGFGNTDASQKLEHATMAGAGTYGNGLIMGANADVLQHLLDEAATQHQVRLRTSLRAGGGAALPAAVTHDRPKTADPIDAQLDWARSLPGARQ